jgi:regulatory protein
MTSDQLFPVLASDSPENAREPAASEPANSGYDLQAEETERERRLAMDAAVRMLALREHSRGELGQKLERKGYPRELIEQILAKLEDLDLQSDERFLDSFVRGRLSKGHGPIRIRHDLAQKGVAESLVEQVLTYEAEFWLDHAERARSKRFGENKPRGDDKGWNAQARFLAQRGFPSDLIYTVLGSRY